MTERLEVRGRVLVRRSLRPAQTSDSWLRNVQRTVRLFLTYEMPDVDVTVERRGEHAKGRTDRMNKYKELFANDTKARTLQEALKGVKTKSC